MWFFVTLYPSDPASRNKSFFCWGSDVPCSFWASVETRIKIAACFAMVRPEPGRALMFLSMRDVVQASAYFYLFADRVGFRLVFRPRFFGSATTCPRG